MLNYQAQTKEITLKTRPHAVNTCWKRVSQSSLTEQLYLLPKPLLELMKTWPSKSILFWQKAWASSGWLGSRFASGKALAQFSPKFISGETQSTLYIICSNHTVKKNLHSIIFAFSNTEKTWISKNIITSKIFYQYSSISSQRPVKSINNKSFINKASSLINNLSTVNQRNVYCINYIIYQNNPRIFRIANIGNTERLKNWAMLNFSKKHISTCLYLLKEQGPGVNSISAH